MKKLTTCYILFSFTALTEAQLLRPSISANTAPATAGLPSAGQEGGALVLDTSSGQLKGTLHAGTTGRFYLYDAMGVLNFIIQPRDDQSVNVFDLKGNWLYTVRNQRIVYDRDGNIKTVLRVEDGRVLLAHPIGPSANESRKADRFSGDND